MYLPHTRRRKSCGISRLERSRSIHFSGGLSGSGRFAAFSKENIGRPTSAARAQSTSSTAIQPCSSNIESAPMTRRRNSSTMRADSSAARSVPITGVSFSSSAAPRSKDKFSYNAAGSPASTRSYSYHAGMAASRDSGERKMCAVIPHILPKGGSGAAPLLDTPAFMMRFMDRSRRAVDQFCIMPTWSRWITRKGVFALPCTPSTKGFRAPGPTSRAWRFPSPPAPNHERTYAVRSR